MLVTILTIITFVAAALDIRAEYLGPQAQVYFFKPLITTCILLIATQAQKPVSSRYQHLITAGMFFSLVGDVLLMLPLDAFVPGLISFLIAQVIFVFAFRSSARPGRALWMVIPLAAYGILMFVLLLPGLDGLMIPVIVYLVVILAMAWRGWNRWFHSRERSTLLALVGALLFVVSDSALAIGKFRGRYGAQTAVVMITYVLAQWLIAYSVSGEGDSEPVP